MSFREQIATSIDQSLAFASIGETRQLGAAYVGGSIRRMVEIDATSVNIERDAEIPIRYAAGIVHSLEVPVLPEEPLQLHIAESKGAHTGLAQIIGGSKPGGDSTPLPLASTQRHAGFSMASYSQIDGLASLFMFFGDMYGRNLTADDTTIRGLTAAVLNIYGADLVSRTPGTDTLKYTIEISKSERYSHSTKYVPSHKLGSYIVPFDIRT